MSPAEQIENHLTKETHRQLEHHATYVELVGKVLEEARTYFLERSDELASVVRNHNAGPTAPVDLLYDDLSNNDFMDNPRGGGVSTNDSARLKTTLRWKRLSVCYATYFVADIHRRRHPSSASQTER